MRDILKPFSAAISHLLSQCLLWKGADAALFDRKAKKTLWASGTARQSTWQCVMLKDGNFVVFNAQYEIVWQTNTGRSGCNGCKLVLKDDGSLQIINATDEPIWVRSKDVKNMTRPRSKRKS